MEKDENEIKDEKNYERLCVRVPKDFKNLIESQATLENTTASVLSRTAINWYLHKDVNYKGQLEATVESLRSDMRKMSRELELFSSLFKFWTQYYFTLTASLSDLSPEARKARSALGKRQSEIMLQSFRGTMKEVKPGLIEALVADYLVSDSEK